MPRSAGLNEYIKEDCENDHPLPDYNFAQGDIVTTTIKCARGETITLRLDTSLPRAYSRRFEIHGVFKQKTKNVENTSKKCKKCVVNIEN